MQIRINGGAEGPLDDVGALIPQALGSAPWRIELDAGNGLRLEAISGDDGRFDVAYIETKQRYGAAASMDRAALADLLNRFQARDPSWRHAAIWRFEAPAPRRSPSATRPRLTQPLSPKQRERHASIAGVIVLGGAALLVGLQLFGIRLSLPTIALPAPFQSPGATILLVFGGLVWSLLALAAAYKLWEVRQARHWLRTSGTVLAADIAPEISDGDGGLSARRVPTIRYRYKVGTRTHEGSRFDMGERPPAMTREELAERYPIGTSVDVWYDPDAPETATLDRDLPAGAAKGCLVATAFALPVLLGLAALATVAPGWVRHVLPNANPVVFLVALAASALFSTLAFSEHRKRGRARGWPSTAGVVETSDIEQRGNFNQRASLSFVPRVVYRYQVDGETYRGRQIRLGIESGGSRGYAEGLRSRYPVGSPVTVFYDPAAPEDAALEWDESVPKYLALVAAVAFAIALWASGLWR